MANDLIFPSLKDYQPEQEPDLVYPDISSLAQPHPKRGAQYDGDTLYRRDGTGERLLGIDTPELKDHLGGTEARERAKELRALHNFTPRKVGYDHNGRELVEETNEDGVTLTEMLIREGFGNPMLTEDPRFYAAQQERERAYMAGDDPLANQRISTTDADNKQALKNTAVDKRGWQERAVGRGVDNLQATGYAFLDAVGDLTGIESLEQFGEEGAQRNLEEAAASPADIANWKEVDGVMDGLKYVAESVIENVPSIGVDLGVGAAAALTAPFTGGASLAVAGGAMAARQVAINRFKKGMVAAMYPQMAGEAQMHLNQNGVDSAATALFLGGINTGLEYVGIDRLLSAVKFGGDGAVERVRDVLIAPFIAAGKAAPAEGVTELAQQVVNELGTIAHKPSHEISRDELIEAFLRGAAAGGGMAGVGRTVTAPMELLKGRSAPATEEAPADEAGPTVGEAAQAAGVDPTHHTPEGEGSLRRQAQDLVDEKTSRGAVSVVTEEEVAIVKDELDKHGYDYQINEENDRWVFVRKGSPLNTSTNAGMQEAMGAKENKSDLVVSDTVALEALDEQGNTIYSELVSDEHAEARQAELVEEYGHKAAEVVAKTPEQGQADRANNLGAIAGNKSNAGVATTQLDSLDKQVTQAEDEQQDKAAPRPTALVALTEERSAELDKEAVALNVDPEKARETYRTHVDRGELIKRLIPVVEGVENLSKKDAQVFLDSLDTEGLVALATGDAKVSIPFRKGGTTAVEGATSDQLVEGKVESSKLANAFGKLIRAMADLEPTGYKGDDISPLTSRLGLDKPERFNKRSGENAAQWANRVGALLKKEERAIAAQIGKMDAAQQQDFADQLNLAYSGVVSKGKAPITLHEAKSPGALLSAIADFKATTSKKKATPKQSKREAGVAAKREEERSDSQRSMKWLMDRLVALVDSEGRLPKLDELIEGQTPSNIASDASEKELEKARKQSLVTEVRQLVATLKGTRVFQEVIGDNNIEVGGQLKKALREPVTKVGAAYRVLADLVNIGRQLDRDQSVDYDTLEQGNIDLEAEVLVQYFDAYKDQYTQDEIDAVLEEFVAARVPKKQVNDTMSVAIKPRFAPVSEADEKTWSERTVRKALADARRRLDQRESHQRHKLLNELDESQNRIAGLTKMKNPLGLLDELKTSAAVQENKDSYLYVMRETAQTTKDASTGQISPTKTAQTFSDEGMSQRAFFIPLQVIATNYLKAAMPFLGLDRASNGGTVRSNGVVVEIAGHKRNESRALEGKRIVTLDFETSRSSEDGHDIKQMGHRRYFQDDRTYAGVMVTVHDTNNGDDVILLEGEAAIAEYINTELRGDPNVAVAMHNAPFDTMILNDRFGYMPPVILDTMKLYQRLNPLAKPRTVVTNGATEVVGSYTLAAITRELLPAKYHKIMEGGVLDQVDGVPLDQVEARLGKEVREALDVYAKQDTLGTAKLVDELLHFITDEQAVETSQVSQWYVDRSAAKGIEGTGIQFRNPVKHDGQLGPVVVDAAAAAKSNTADGSGANLLEVTEYRSDKSGMQTMNVKYVDAVYLSQLGKGAKPKNAVEAMERLLANLSRMEAGSSDFGDTGAALEGSPDLRVKYDLPVLHDNLVIFFGPNRKPITLGEARVMKRYMQRENEARADIANQLGKEGSEWDVQDGLLGRQEELRELFNEDARNGVLDELEERNPEAQSLIYDIADYLDELFTGYDPETMASSGASTMWRQFSGQQKRKIKELLSGIAVERGGKVSFKAKPPADYVNVMDIVDEYLDNESSIVTLRQQTPDRDFVMITNKVEGEPDDNVGSFAREANQRHEQLTGQSGLGDGGRRTEEEENQVAADRTMGENQQRITANKDELTPDMKDAQEKFAGEVNYVPMEGVDYESLDPSYVHGQMPTRPGMRVRQQDLTNPILPKDEQKSAAGLLRNHGMFGFQRGKELASSFLKSVLPTLRIKVPVALTTPEGIPALLEHMKGHTNDAAWTKKFEETLLEAKAEGKPAYINAGSFAVIVMPDLPRKGKKKAVAKFLLMLGHEIGHLVYDLAYQNNSKKLRAAYLASTDYTKNKKTFSEWYADQVSLALMQKYSDLTEVKEGEPEPARKGQALSPSQQEGADRDKEYWQKRRVNLAAQREIESKITVKKKAQRAAKSAEGEAGRVGKLEAEIEALSSQLKSLVQEQEALEAAADAVTPKSTAAISNTVGEPTVEVKTKAPIVDQTTTLFVRRVFGKVARSLKTVYGAVRKALGMGPLTPTMESFVDDIIWGRKDAQMASSLPEKYQWETQNFTAKQKPLAAAVAHAKKQWKEGKVPTGRALWGTTIGSIGRYSDQLAKMLFQRSGQDTAYGRSYEAKHKQLRGQMMGLLEKAIVPMMEGKVLTAKALLAGDYPARVNQAFKDFARGVETADSKRIGEMINKIDALMAEHMPEYKREGKLPNAFDHNTVEAKRKQLIDKLAKTAEFEGASRAVLEESIDLMLDGDGNSAFAIGPGRPVGMHGFTALILKSVDNKWLVDNGFLLEHPVMAMTHFIAGGSKRAAWEHTFGGYVEGDDGTPMSQRKAGKSYNKRWSPNAKYLELRKQVEKQHGLAAAGEVDLLVRGALGHRNREVAHGARRWMENWINISSFAILGMSGVASIPEMMVPLIRAGDAMPMREIFAAMKDFRQAKEFAYDIGVVQRETIAQLSHAVDAGYEGVLTRRMAGVFFMANGQSMITRTTRVLATAIARQYLIRAAQTNDAEALARLHIKPATVRAWQNGDAKATQAVTAAIHQFVNEATLEPSKFQNTGWMNNPYFALVSYLKRFMFTFADTVLGGIWRGFSRQYGKNRMDQGAILAAATAALPYLIGGSFLMLFGALSMELRDWIKGENRTDTMPWADYFNLAFSKMGGYGPLEILLTLKRAHDWDQSLVGALAAPVGVAERSLEYLSDGQFQKAIEFHVPVL